MQRRKQGARRNPASATPPRAARPAKRAASGSRLARASFNPLAWLAGHGEAARFSLGRLYQGRLGSALTLSVIAIALAMPAALYLIVDNARGVAHGWDDAVQLSVFMQPGVDAESATTTARQIEQREDVRDVQVITPDDALAEFRRWSGYDQATALLDQNPLPALIVVQPQSERPEAIERLADELADIERVDQVQLDREWLERFFALLDIGQRIILMLAVLLSLAVIVIAGNTIRLEIHNQRHEIEVMKLVGATDAFIRRPFLYTGLWYGFLGGVAAWLVVAIGLALMGGPVQRLTELYDSDFRLAGLGLETGAILIGTAMVLGWLGAWLAVGRHLHAIEPK